MGRDQFEEIHEDYGYSEEEVKDAIRWALDNPEYVRERLEIIKKRLAEEEE